MVLLRVLLRAESLKLSFLFCLLVLCRAEESSETLVTKWLSEKLGQMESLWRNATEELRTKFETPLKEDGGKFRSMVETSQRQLQERMEELESTVIHKLSHLEFDANNIRDEVADYWRNLTRASVMKIKCKTDWILFQDSCYYFSTVRATWSAGRKDCLTKGGDYVKVTSDDEFGFIYTHVRENTHIGLSDREEEGTYRWTDGTKHQMERKWWHSGQPDDSRGVEDCIRYWFNGGIRNWNDGECNATLQFVCEMKPDVSFDLS